MPDGRYTLADLAPEPTAPAAAPQGQFSLNDIASEPSPAPTMAPIAPVASHAQLSPADALTVLSSPASRPAPPVAIRPELRSMQPPTVPTVVPNLHLAPGESPARLGYAPPAGSPESVRALAGDIARRRIEAETAQLVARDQERKLAGPRQIGQGLSGGVQAARTLDPEGAMNAAADVGEGAFKVLEPTLLPAAVVAPVPTLAGLIGGTAAQTGAQKLAAEAGLSPGAQRLASLGGAIIGGGVAAKGAHQVPGLVRSRLAARTEARPVEAVADALRDSLRAPAAEGGATELQAPRLRQTPTEQAAATSLTEALETAARQSESAPRLRKPAPPVPAKADGGFTEADLAEAERAPAPEVAPAPEPAYIEGRTDVRPAEPPRPAPVPAEGAQPPAAGALPEGSRQAGTPESRPPLATGDAEGDRLFASSYERARGGGYAGRPEDLRSRFDERLASARETVRDLTDTEEEFGGRGLLKVIADAGGIGHPSKELTYPEVAQAIWDASTGVRDMGSGARGQARRVKFLPSGDIAGVKAVTNYRGRQIDSVLEAIEESGRFPEIKSVQDLEAAIGRIVEHERNPDLANGKLSLKDLLEAEEEADPEWWADDSFNTAEFESVPPDLAVIQPGKTLMQKLGGGLRPKETAEAPPAAEVRPAPPVRVRQAPTEAPVLAKPAVESGRIAASVTPKRGPGDISTPQNPPQPEGGQASDRLQAEGVRLRREIAHFNRLAAEQQQRLANLAEPVPFRGRRGDTVPWESRSREERAKTIQEEVDRWKAKAQPLRQRVAEIEASGVALPPDPEGIKWVGAGPSETNVAAMFQVGGRDYSVKANALTPESEATWLRDAVGDLATYWPKEKLAHVEFYLGKWGSPERDFSITGTGNAFRVFRHVRDVLREFLRDQRFREDPVSALAFSAVEKNRANLYRRLVTELEREFPEWVSVERIDGLQDTLARAAKNDEVSALLGVVRRDVAQRAIDRFNREHPHATYSISRPNPSGSPSVGEPRVSAKPAPPVPPKPTEAERILSEMKATTDKEAPPVAEVPFSLEREARAPKAVQGDLLGNQVPDGYTPPQRGKAKENQARKDLETSGQGAMFRGSGREISDAEAQKLAETFDREMEAGAGPGEVAPARRSAEKVSALPPLKPAFLKASKAVVQAVRPNAVQLRPSEIIAGMSKHFEGLPVREGVGRHKVLGFYRPKAQVIRLKVAGDVDTAAHEFGHHLDMAVLGLPRAKQAWTPELMKLGAFTSRASYTAKQIRQEGAAEFLRRYLVEPDVARQMAPLYYSAFEKALETQPDLAKMLAVTRRQVRGWLAQDPADKAKARIDFNGVDPKPGGDLLTRMQTAWVDDLTPLRRMTEDLADGQPLDARRDGYTLARLSRGAATKADGFLRHGVKDAAGKEIAGSFDAAIRPVRKHLEDFATYLVASRVPELRMRGIETGMTAEEALGAIRKFETPEFRAARDSVYAYQDGLLSYLEQSGAASPQQIAKIRKLNPHYVPFQRVLDQVEGHLVAPKSNRLANRSLPIKRIKGSGHDIVNPLESIVRNTHAIVDMVEKNRAMKALVDQAVGTKGGGYFLEEIPTPQVGTKFNLQQLTPAIREALEKAGIDELPDNLADALSEMVTVFTPAQFPRGNGGVVTVMEQGKRRWFQVNDAALYDAITAVGSKSPDIVINLFMRPARLLRAGATTTLGFAARNPVRDTLTAAVNSRYGFRPGWDTLRGLFEYAKAGEDYQQFLNSGGGNSAMVAIDRNRIRDYLRGMGKSRLHALATEIPRHPLELLRAFSEATENATRLGEFMRAVEKEGRTPEGYARAALAARDVTLDFARGGRQAKAINQYVPFFNAGLQGQARLVEVFRKDPIGATARSVTSVMLPSMALWYLNHDNEEYRELPAWERNTYWHVPLGAGKGFAKIPKPFELGNIFGNLTEAALDYLTDKDPQFAKRLFPNTDSALDAFISLMPAAVLPLYEAKANYDTFRDRSIVSPWDLGLDTELQYGRWTSETAKILGPKIGLAPAVFDHLVYGYTAGLGRGVVHGIDVGLEAVGAVDRNKPAGGPERWPLLSAFYRGPSGADAQSIADFYDAKEEVSGKLRSIERYKAQGDRQRARVELADLKTAYPNATAFAKRLNAANKEMTALRDEVDTAIKSRQLSPEAKREQLGRIYERMVNTARRALGKAPLPARFPSANAKGAPPVPVRQVAQR